MRRLLILITLVSLTNMTHAEIPASWTRSVEPVRIAGNLYYVGTEELGSYLIADQEGLILLDVPLAENVEVVWSNVAKLGFDPKKIRILLASHAHLDHVGGFAGMKVKTGATVFLSAADAELAARGGKGDPNFGDTFSFPAIVADRIVKDGEVVRLGGTVMTAILTPGHTPGCTTWRTTVEEGGKMLDVVFLCSVTAPGYRLMNNSRYPQIFDDYRTSFEKLRQLDPDIFLGNHASFFGLAEKLAKKKNSGANPFIVRGELAKYLEKAWKQLEAERARQASAK